MSVGNGKRVGMLSNDLTSLGEAASAFFQRDHGMLINGQWESALNGETIDAIDPSTCSVVSAVPAAQASDVDRAVKAAREAFDGGPWPRMKPVDRERRILKLADLLEANATEFSEIESVNSGRSLFGTRAFDVDMSVDYLRYMAGWATKIEGRTIQPSARYVPDGRFFSFSTYEPLGVVAGITPWNVPLGQAIWKIAPVLATGCTIVLKPAEQTSLTALRFGELLAEADIPPGVVNIVTGLGQVAGAALVEHPLVDKIGFTGSTEIGRSINQIAARDMKKVTLELGGKSPVIVFDDADLDLAIEGAAWAIYGNHGQNCCAGSRLFVHKSIFDKVVSGVAQVAESIHLGAGLDPSTEMGPLVSKRQQERVLSYIESGLNEGGVLATGGKSLDHPGCYVEPTVMVNTNDNMKLVREEIFGPVVVVMPFEDEAEVVERANDSVFGLGASVWTRDINVFHRMSPQLAAGTVWLNTHNVLDPAVPFGGMKNSGIGHELGEEAIKQHTNLKVNTLFLS